MRAGSWWLSETMHVPVGIIAAKSEKLVVCTTHKPWTSQMREKFQGTPRKAFAPSAPRSRSLATLKYRGWCLCVVYTAIIPRATVQKHILFPTSTTQQKHCLVLHWLRHPLACMLRILSCLHACLKKKKKKRFRNSHFVMSLGQCALYIWQLIRYIFTRRILVCLMCDSLSLSLSQCLVWLWLFVSYTWRLDTSVHRCTAQCMRMP